MAVASLGQAFRDLPLVWLALDEDDNDPIIFIWLLAVAPQKRFPGSFAKAMALLGELPPSAPELQQVIRVLINEVLHIDPSPFALVLDDYHLITTFLAARKL